MWLIALLAVPVGAAGAGLAVGLLRLIGLITNCVFYQRVATTWWRRGAAHHPGGSCCWRRWRAGW